MAEFELTSTEASYRGKHTRSESLSEDAQMAATCTRKKWIIALLVGGAMLIFILGVAIGVPVAAAGASANEAQITVDPCANYNCTVCPCRQNSTCVPSPNSPNKPLCVSGPILADGASCDDGDSSTMKDVCKAGVCKGVALTCDGIDCSGGYYGFDGCHGTARCELLNGATNCVPHQYEDGYICNRGTTSEGRCWKGSCVSNTSYTRNVNMDPCRTIKCPEVPMTSPDCYLNGTGVCSFNGYNISCNYKPAETNTPCEINGTAGLCGAFGNCRLPNAMTTSSCPQ